VEGIVMPNIDLGACLQSMLMVGGFMGVLFLVAYFAAKGEFERFEVFGMPKESADAFVRESMGTGKRIASKLASLGYWTPNTTDDDNMFSRVVATPEAIYYRVRLSDLKSNIRPAQLTIPDLIEHLQYATERRISTVSQPEFGVWFIVHRAGYEITDESYKPYLDKMKNDGM
jgi:hypothetical protein